MNNCTKKVSPCEIIEFMNGVKNTMHIIYKRNLISQVQCYAYFLSFHCLSQADKEERLHLMANCHSKTQLDHNEMNPPCELCINL